MTGTPQRAAISSNGQRHVERVRGTLDDAGAHDEGEWCAAADREAPDLTRMHATILVGTSSRRYRRTTTSDDLCRLRSSHRRVLWR